MKSHPCVVRACNATWQWAHDNALLDAVAQGADLLLLVECRDIRDRPVDVQAALGRDWDVQQDMSSGERAGSATAVRRGSGLEAVRSRLTLLSPAGPGVQARWLRTTAVRNKATRTRIRALAGHLALAHTGRQDDGQRALTAKARSLGALTWVFGGDVNGPAAPIAHMTGADGFHGVSPMAMCWANLHGDPATDRAFAHADHHVISRRVTF